MADLPDEPGGAPRGGVHLAAGAEPVEPPSPSLPASDVHDAVDQAIDEATGDVIELLEETVAVSTARRSAGRVRISTRTELHEETVEAELDRYRVEVTRVPVGRVVEAAPSARVEGDTTIIPVLEERLVTVKQLVLVEELHVRHVVERRTVSEPVTLRRQTAVVERLDAPEPGGERDGERG